MANIQDSMKSNTFKKSNQYLLVSTLIPMNVFFSNDNNRVFHNHTKLAFCQLDTFKMFSFIFTLILLVNMKLETRRIILPGHMLC